MSSDCTPFLKLESWGENRATIKPTSRALRPPAWQNQLVPVTYVAFPEITFIKCRVMKSVQWNKMEQEHCSFSGSLHFHQGAWGGRCSAGHKTKLLIAQAPIHANIPASSISCSHCGSQNDCPDTLVQEIWEFNSNTYNFRGEQQRLHVSTMCIVYT